MLHSVIKKGRKENEEREKEKKKEREREKEGKGFIQRKTEKKKEKENGFPLPPTKLVLIFRQYNSQKKKKRVFSSYNQREGAERELYIQH